MRGLGQLLRASTTGLPRGTRPPEEPPWPAQHGPWWGPWSLPFASDGSIAPVAGSNWGDAQAATLAIPAAWRATNLIAGFLAQMQMRCLDGDPPQHIDQSRQLLNNPWPLITYFDWMFGAAASIVLRGNFYAVKADLDPNTGQPRQYIPVSVDDVTVNFDKGQLTYDIVGMDRTLRWFEVFHARGFMLPGMLTGVGVIEAHRNGLFQTRQLMDYGAGAYSQGAVPPVVMTVDKPELSEAEAEYLQSRWVTRHTAMDRRPAVVPKIVDVKTVGLSMQDAEYLQSRQFSIAEIAYMFNLDPMDLSAGFGSGSGRMQYQNLETRMRERLIFSLTPWMNRIEQTYANDLPGNCYAKFNTADLFRGDSLQRMQMYEIALRNNIYTHPEVRILEHLPIDDYDLFGMNEDHDIEWPEHQPWPGPRDGEQPMPGMSPPAAENMPQPLQAWHQAHRPAQLPPVPPTKVEDEPQ
jgi:HK97 family phage portal protein